MPINQMDFVMMNQAQKTIKAAFENMENQLAAMSGYMDWVNYKKEDFKEEYKPVGSTVYETMQRCHKFISDALESSKNIINGTASEAANSAEAAYKLNENRGRSSSTAGNRTAVQPQIGGNQNTRSQLLRTSETGKSSSMGRRQ